MTTPLRANDDQPDVGADSWTVPAFSTFMQAPTCDPHPDAIRAAGAKAAFFGAVVECGVLPYRVGTTLGPAACREASLQFVGYTTLEFEIPVRDYWGIVDCGDASIPGAPIQRIHDRIRAMAEAILQGGAIPVMCGGDHSIPIPGVAALSRFVEGRIGYLHIDAHLDTAEDVAGERYTMASPVARILENPKVDPRNVVIIGARGASNPPSVIAKARELGIRVIPMTDVIARGVQRAINDALDVIWDGTDTIYVSFDNDSMDVSCGMGTTAPEPFGFTSREVWQMATAIGERGVGMLDIAELSPRFDPSGVTARIDCYWIMYILSAYARSIEEGRAQPPRYTALTKEDA